uniref:Mei2-like C-terminal RNA recognition motif domain-containing protein n=1 Tax=Noctiluca scintillans TaxID=2966 RepID=A0A7S1F7P8_NOCSC|mmetsp:Transcript_41224/g.109095  ORF Transcript_41224/g.109095 Transcript_41224/m.109095 type:complete len:276 (+) Transcript_41224:61-888(+)
MASPSQKIVSSLLQWASEDAELNEVLQAEVHKRMHCIMTNGQKDSSPTPMHELELLDQLLDDTIVDKVMEPSSAQVTAMPLEVLQKVGHAGLEEETLLKRLLDDEQPEQQDPEDIARDVTTVVLQQIPRGANVQQLLSNLHQRGFTGTYDFLYMPKNFDTRDNRGYAIVNFRTTEFAEMFRSVYHGASPSCFPWHTGKFLQLRVKPANRQGLIANVNGVSRTVGIRDPTNVPMVFVDGPYGNGIPLLAGSAAELKETVDRILQRASPKAIAPTFM